MVRHIVGPTVWNSLFFFVGPFRVYVFIITPSGIVHCRQRGGDTSANKRTNDGTDDDVNDGSNIVPAFAGGANCTDAPDMSPTSENLVVVRVNS